MKESLTLQETRGENNYEQILKKFYENDSLELDTNEIIDNVEQIRNGKNLTVLNDFIINNDLLLSNNDSGKVTLSCRKIGDDIFVSKENYLDKMNTGNILEIESFLKSKNFQNRNVLLPIETIESTSDKKIFRFYEAGDTDLEKYANLKRAMPIKKCISILIRICDGVNSLHKIGVANIDLAPLNVIITKNDVKITDIDSAGIDYDSSGKFITNNFRKNRFTSAPELFKNGNAVDKTVDIYAASCIFFRLLYGNWPYNIEEYCHNHNINIDVKQKIYEYLHNVGNINFPEDTDINVRKIIEKGMETNPLLRYNSMEELIIDLIELNNITKIKE